MQKTLGNPIEQQRIAARLGGVTAESRARWGRMNPVEMLCHLSEAFSFALGDRPIASRRSLLRGPAGRYFALRSPVPWMRGYPTLPELDMKLRKTGNLDLGAKTAELTLLVERFCSCPARELAPEHPIFGRMTREEWMLWGYRHTDHHLRQFGC